MKCEIHQTGRIPFWMHIFAMACIWRAEPYGWKFEIVWGQERNEGQGQFCAKLRGSNKLTVNIVYEHLALTCLTLDCTDLTKDTLLNFSLNRAMRSQWTIVIWKSSVMEPIPWPLMRSQENIYHRTAPAAITPKMISHWYQVLNLR